ncbi:uncharacterized protein TNCV_3036191 [Trichonephila clavipes]|nr:uncharacterized protein TNCV_3036191 [Trichonephila clavipes]
MNMRNQVPSLNCGGGDRWCHHISFLRGISPSKFVLSPVWCSRPRPTTGVLLAPFHDEFHDPRSDYVRQATSDILGALRHIYGPENTIRKTGIRLKRRHCAIPVSSFVIRCTRVAVSVFDGLSREAEVMSSVLTVHATANIVSPYECILSVVQTSPLLD